MRLEKYLILNKYLLSLFGASSISDLRDELNNKKEGFDNDGKSLFVDVLIGLHNLKIDPKDLLKYDSAIKKYSQKLSNYRRDSIILKYFQYLAVLFAEIYLDRYFNRKQELLSELNSFLGEYNQQERVDISSFEEKDLKKLAYWMATGSGKTLIMHINYWQFLKYNFPLDNIIMVTPNEGLSKQHYNEMQRSGVPCRLYSGNTEDLTLYKNEVLIIDLHKLKLPEDKKGEGVTIDTAWLEGKNLVLIDEGHKGQGSEEQKWKRTREEIGKDGFIFEYSATFEQVIGPNDKDLLNEYSKAIIFDYSYKYFYTDGYGKDFYVYSHTETKFTEEYADLVLTANLLSFYEQSILYEKYRDELRRYLVEKPLWVFVGSSVVKRKNKLSVEEEKTVSDVLRVVLFLKEVIENRKFLEKYAVKILNGRSGLHKEGNDIFKDRFQYIKENGYNANDIYKRLFNSNSGALQLSELKSAEGEIGLKIGEGNCFGVINIGDVSTFKKLLVEKGIEVKSDIFTPSLFERVQEANSNINIIIGAKKFIEGWDSWRVCSMGLINMGKGEGPQIIQLFGRGVRLKGEELSLKRSKENKYQIKALETLNIFGLNADYINSFLETLRKEEVEYEEIKLPIKRLEESKWRRLYTLKPNKDFDFSKHYMELEPDENILRNIKIDIRPKIRLAHGMETATSEIVPEKVSLKSYCNLFNWDNIYLNLLEFKVSKGYCNLRINKDVLTEIIKKDGYEVYAESSQIELKILADMDKLEEILSLVLKNYIEKYYSCNFRRTEAKRLQLSFMVKEEDNLTYDYHTLKIEIPKDKDEKDKRKKEIEKIKKLLKEVDKLYQKDIEEIPTIHFDKHLYTPLVAFDKHKEFIKSEPVKLNDGETQFIKKLRDYIKQNQVKDKEIFLLRNLSRRGVGFFQNSGFYPDFIMWVKENDKQTIVFIDPKGIRNLGNFNDEKIQLYKNIKELEREINNYNIKLESMILSVSKYEDVKKTFEDGKRKKEEFENSHILFMNDEKLAEKILQFD